jgi:HTH-type transcriptional regulator/antitoxin HigA
MDIRPIRNEGDHKWALAEIEKYFDREPVQGSPDADRFDVLATLIEAYERERWTIEPMDPIEALREFMTLTGKTQTDRAKLLGYRSRASDVLLGRRKLTTEMIRKLSQEWGVPSDLLLGPYEEKGRAA